ncbi:MAG: glycerol-3-phosphate dehydrogenase subunit GlpB [Siculibacillus sp.]|nr:glycerol-3-phosphate dehydrogenase subunit GlpB [Siculibacillus sp.]
MTAEPRRITTDVAIIGTGLAGFAAAVFCLDRGIEALQLGHAGALSYTTGYFDLIGYDGGRPIADPWAALADLEANWPGHPLARMPRATIERAFRRFTQAIGELGIAYVAPGAGNVRALLPTGLAKTTCSIPATMAAGVAALADGKRTVIIDLVGLVGFSAAEFVANFAADWPALRAARLGFPDMDGGGEAHPEVMARALEVRATRERLAERIRAVVGDAECVGLPAILGVHAPDRVHAAMEELVGSPIFEIPTMPPAVPGLRLRELLEQAMPARGLRLVSQHKAARADLRPDRIDLTHRDNFGEVVVEAATAILATGRFLSGGLTAERTVLREPLFDLPVEQPASRADWHREDCFDPRGHAINRAGVIVDDDFRPLDAAGAPVHPRLFAAGAILAGQDWVRQRCGAGLAIATAWGAVEAAAGVLGR